MALVPEAEAKAASSIHLPDPSIADRAAQGRTADHVIVHADSKATNLVDQKSFYVGISRAKESATIVTNDRAKLTSAINERAGVVQTALSQTPAARAVVTPAAISALAAEKAIGSAVSKAAISLPGMGL